MSNLGTYQWITRKSKEVGGPINLLLITGAVGALCYKLGELGVKKCIEVIKLRKTSRTQYCDPRIIIYSVTSSGMSNEGVEFKIGNHFRVLESNGESVLIEKIGDEDNPYFVSAKFLRTISDFEA